VHSDPLTDKRISRPLLRCCVLLLAAWLVGGCASLPADVPRLPSTALAAPADAPLARAASNAGVPAGLSGFWPMPVSSFALDARLALIRNARASLDLQYYFIGDDDVGHLILRELRDAAGRGVRVRLLLDDLHTQGMDPLLLGLQAHPNVEVRLFNPFGAGRGSSLGRFVSFAGDFRRLNHRMHNKLFIADAAMGIVGGRNLADEYFLRSHAANFIDMDLLATGALMGQLNALFDRYWNSEQAFPLAALLGGGESPEALREGFDRRVAARPDDPSTLPSGPDPYGEPPLSAQLAEGKLHLLVAEGQAHADAPAKAAVGAHAGTEVDDTVAARFVSLVRKTRGELIIFSPYFIPGRVGIERLREARSHGIEVRVVTNATATSDAPFVNYGYERYRDEMLGMGIKIYELSAARLVRDAQLRRAFGSSRGRLHAKMAFVDREVVLVGSMNLDPRSAFINTEIGVAVRSPQLARMILDAYHVDAFTGVYEVRLRDDGRGVQWIGHDEEGEEVLVEAPEMGAWQRLKLWLMSWFVPEDLL
jgi:phosphatidylserine/phosphatidylglycerophosphate/cardiolipin synthase-like enzyme